MFVDGQEFDDDWEAQIESLVADEEGVPPAEFTDWQSPQHREPLAAYRAAVVEYVREYLPNDSEAGVCDGLRVAVDCGNGMAALATPQVLDTLGATVVALNANVDGRFPGRPSKPTPETLGDLQAFVADGEFDLGIAHDGDADRIVILDGDGEIVHEDTIVAMLAGYYTRRSTKEGAGDSVVVTTPNASGRIDEVVESAGGRTERVRLGALHEGIAAAARDGGSVVFAAEPWKHIHPEFGGWIDGVVSAALLAGLVAADGLADLREPITERPYRKVSIDCPESAKESAMTTLESSMSEAFPEASVSLDHGVRLTLPTARGCLCGPPVPSPTFGFMPKARRSTTSLLPRPNKSRQPSTTPLGQQSEDLSEYVGVKNGDNYGVALGVFGGGDEFLVVGLVCRLVGNPTVGDRALIVKHVDRAVGDAVEAEIWDLHLKVVVADRVAAHVADERKRKVVLVAERAK